MPAAKGRGFSSVGSHEAPVLLHLVHRRQEALVQGVDLGRRGGARSRELERERLAADAQSAGGIVDAIKSHINGQE